MSSLAVEQHQPAHRSLGHRASRRNKTRHSSSASSSPVTPSSSLTPLSSFPHMLDMRPFLPSQQPDTDTGPSSSSFSSSSSSSFPFSLSLASASPASSFSSSHSTSTARDDNDSGAALTAEEHKSEAALQPSPPSQLLHSDHDDDYGQFIAQDADFAASLPPLPSSSPTDCRLLHSSPLSSLPPLF